MDKKDLKDEIKQVILVYAVVLVNMIIMSTLIFAIINIFSKDAREYIYKIVHFLVELIGGIGIFIGVLGIMFILVFTIIKIKRIRNTVKSQIYVRNLPKNFPPAIASLILDLNTEVTTDYTATIAYLICKKYINLDNNEIKILNNDTHLLYEHQRYAFDCITNSKKFNDTEFRNIVLEDAKKMGLIKEGKKPIHFFRNIGIDLILFFISAFIREFIPDESFLYTILLIIGALAGISFFPIMISSLYLASRCKYENIYRTNSGEKEAIKWKGLKNYFNHFTLISERDLKDIVLFEDYIPYAISLNEANNIEKYIENNNIYRELIYGKKSYIES